jgi:ABC-2 type transport system permease protein
MRDFIITSLKMRLSEQMVYKFNFILRVMTLLSFDLVLPLVTILIYIRSEGFPGWDFHQILMFQGIFIFINSIDRMFFQRVDWSLSYDVRSGDFDRYLLYPINPLAYISLTNFGFEHIADFFIGIGLVAYSAAMLSLSPTLGQVLLFLGYLFLALLFVFSIAVFKYSIIIRAVRMGRLGELFRVAKTYGQYPVDIYRGFLSSVFRYMIPLAVLAYYPSNVLLGRAAENFFVIALIIGIIFTLCVMLWNNTLKYYTSAGG